MEAPKKLFFSFFGLFRNCLNCDSLRWSHIYFIGEKSEKVACRTGVIFFVLQASGKANTKHESSTERESHATDWALKKSRPNPVARESRVTPVLQTTKKVAEWTIVQNLRDTWPQRPLEKLTNAKSLNGTTNLEGRVKVTRETGRKMKTTPDKN